MDTDVEVLKNLDEFLKLKSFSGFESIDSIPTGIMGSEPKVKIFKEFLDYYENKGFITKDGEMDTTTNVTTITNIMSNKGLNKNNQLQTVEEFTLYPKEYFCPIEYSTNKKNITQNTYTIHWFAGSWVPKKEKIRIRIYEFTKKMLGEKLAKKCSNIIKGSKKNGR